MEKYLDDFNSLIESSKIKKESTFGYVESKNIKAIIRYANNVNWMAGVFKRRYPEWAQ